jgi:predicted component of type VI protein secretion system
LDIAAADLRPEFFRGFAETGRKDMKAKLRDAQHGRRWILLNRLPVLLGRSAEAGVQVLDSCVSRRHCEISERDGKLFIRDLGSKNGSLVNGRLAQESWLMPGDTLGMGATTFVIEYETTAEPLAYASVMPSGSGQCASVAGRSRS